MSETLKVSEHWLDPVRREPIPGGNEMRVRRCIVLHFTAGASAMSSVEFWRTKKANGANAHLVIDRDGSVIQCRAFNRTAGHAGKVSRWRDPKSGILFTGCNAFSIGIEVANAGDSDAALRWAKRQPEFAGTVQARHRNGGPDATWEKYPGKQLESVIQVCRLLSVTYNLDDITGHDCIAPERKNDPGPAFPMTVVREACGFPGLPMVHRA